LADDEDVYSKGNLCCFSEWTLMLIRKFTRKEQIIYVRCYRWSLYNR